MSFANVSYAATNSAATVITTNSPQQVVTFGGQEKGAE